MTMHVLVTGADGFIGQNLRLRLAERSDVNILTYGRRNKIAELPNLVKQADFVFHLAGVNRPKDQTDFSTGNAELTRHLCDALARQSAKIPVIYTSSTQAGGDGAYGASKAAAERELASLAARNGNEVHLFRLPNVFGKWARPNYNSAVATFCYNIARDLPITVNDRAAPITLVYVDDVVEQFLKLLDGAASVHDADGFTKVAVQYETTVGAVAELLQAFRSSRDTLLTEPVGTGLHRALYSTYVSYLPPTAFSYLVPMHGDHRGTFVEMLKTRDSGQFSFFTAHPGVTRGGHYHHSKTEKFLVIKGRALFKFRHMQSRELHSIVTDGSKAEIVETVPGWTHDITNISDEELVVMLWANEIFDPLLPDTIASPL
jgi:UDP-2-acetamido-2,6-beta-L-arabino-hexul-4-ose reductase